MEYSLHDKKGVSKNFFVSIFLTIIIVGGLNSYAQGPVSRPTKNKPNNSLEPTKTNVNVSRNGNLFSIGNVSFEMIPVEGGNFQMGSDDKIAEDFEKPKHSESVGTFLIGKTEVTQGLWKAVMKNNPSNWKGDDLPVDNVSWNECQEFIRRLNNLTGEHFRLPTEAEWEYACKGGSKSHGYIYSGSNDINEVAWYDGNSGYKSHVVATKKPNELGIYDMTGNVYEWVNDKWCDNYNSPRKSSKRIIRGGCYGISPRYSRVTFRGDEDSWWKYETFGLRLAL